MPWTNFIIEFNVEDIVETFYEKKEWKKKKNEIDFRVAKEKRW